jgi:hypothetical protein
MVDLPAYARAGYNSLFPRIDCAGGFIQPIFFGRTLFVGAFGSVGMDLEGISTL